MAGYGASSCFGGSMNVQKTKRGQNLPGHLDRTSLVIKDLLYGKQCNFLKVTNG